MPTKIKVTCPYCGKYADFVGGEEVYPHRVDLYDRNFYLCRPCGASVGTHKGTRKPLGTPAKSTLRSLRAKCHELFDPLWKEGSMSRTEAYKALAIYLDIREENCHIGRFDEEMCQRVIEFCERLEKGAKSGTD